MEKIKRDFMLGEFRRLALCAAGLAACLLVLWRCWPGMTSWLPLFLVGFAAVIGLSAVRSAMLARAGTGTLTDSDIYSLEKEYGAPHPVYKVWQGEIHLMQDFLVCRSRGRLIFIPVHGIERVERRLDRIGMRVIPFAKFIMDTNRSFSVGFSPSHPKDCDAVFTWLEKRLGGEKAGH